MQRTDISQHGYHYIKTILGRFIMKNVPYRHSAALLQFNHIVKRQVDFDRANIGGLWLATLLVFSHDLEGSYPGRVTNLEDTEKCHFKQYVFLFHKTDTG